MGFPAFIYHAKQMTLREISCLSLLYSLFPFLRRAQLNSLYPHPSQGSINMLAGARS